MRPAPRFGRNPVILGRKFCTRCAHWRHVCDFGSETRKGKTTLVPRCRACNRLAQLERRSNPEWLTKRREYDRIWKETKRRQNGIEPVRHIRPKPPEPPRWLPVEPLRAELEAWLRRHPGEKFGGRGGQRFAPNWRELSRVTGVPERSVTRVLTENRYVTEQLADRLLIGIGSHLSLVYDYEEATA